MKKQLNILVFLTFSILLLIPTMANCDINLGIVTLETSPNHNPSSANPLNQEELTVRQEKNFFKFLSLRPNISGFPKQKPPEYNTMRYVLSPSKIMLDNGENIRLLGIMSGIELKRYQKTRPHSLKPMKNLTELCMLFLEAYLSGRQLRIKYFEKNVFDPSGDRYAYVYLEDNELINRTLLAAGQGIVSNETPFADFPLFKELEKDARDKGRGVWL